jgi:hypothetical protein
MAPGIALEALGESRVPLRVLDPMAGSGTVLAVARAHGHRAFGFDLDPLAVLLAGVWTRTIDWRAATDTASEVLATARSAFSKISLASAYPSADEETRRFVRYWFDGYARRQLWALARTIKRVRDEPIRDVLWCGFSRLIIAKSSGASLAMDLAHSRPHKKFAHAPVKPFSAFVSAVDTVASNCPQRECGPLGPASVVKTGDARNMRLPAESIDLVLTSPPYLNAIDYMRCSKFSLVWMGYSVKELMKVRGESVGSERGMREALEVPWVKALIKQLRLTPELSEQNRAVLARYVWDMNSAISEVSRVLKKRGRAVYVIGESTTRSTFIRNSTLLEAIAEKNGMSLCSRYQRMLPANRRYLPPPRGRTSAESMDGRLRREVVMEFTKIR